MSILIGILNDDRRYLQFKLFLHFFTKSIHKDKFKIIVLTHADSTKFTNIIDLYSNLFTGIDIIKTGPDYMDKIHSFIEYANLHEYTYCFKMDNDIILPTHMIDYIYENIHILDDDNNGILLPLLSNSIPSIQYVIEDFFNSSEKSIIYDLFSKYKYTNEWAILNDKLIGDWSFDKYYSVIENIKEPHGGNYKAIHPIRFDTDSADYLNSIFIDNKKWFFEDRGCKLYNATDRPYFMPQTFLIKTSYYHNILDKSLAYDGYDEVTINNLIRRDKKEIFFIRNALGIHIAHNGHTKNFLEFEILFLNKFFHNELLTL